MIPAVGIVSVSFNFLWRNENEPPVLPSFRVDVAIHVLYFRRVTICVVAAAGARAIRHAPSRVKLFVDGLILARVVTRGVAVSIFLRLECCREYATEKAAQEQFAKDVQFAGSFWLTPQWKKNAATGSWEWLSASLKDPQPCAGTFPTKFEAFSALL